MKWNNSGSQWHPIFIESRLPICVDGYEINFPFHYFPSVLEWYRAHVTYYISVWLKRSAKYLCEVKYIPYWETNERNIMLGTSVRSNISLIEKKMNGTSVTPSQCPKMCYAGPRTWLSPWHVLSLHSCQARVHFAFYKVAYIVFIFSDPQLVSLIRHYPNSRHDL